MHSSRICFNCTHFWFYFSDTEIHLIETATSSVKYFSGHKGPILCVAIDPRMEYIVRVKTRLNFNMNKIVVKTNYSLTSLKHLFRILKLQ